MPLRPEDTVHAPIWSEIRCPVLVEELEALLSNAEHDSGRDVERANGFAGAATSLVGGSIIVVFG